MPKIKNNEENNMVIKEIKSFFPSNAGETNLQNWYKIIGNPINIPPNKATDSYTVNILVIFNTCIFISTDNDCDGATK